jgi:hypothetical protein
MCPACIGAAAWAVAGTTSAGGLTALILRVLRKRSRASSEVRDPVIWRRSSKQAAPIGSRLSGC